MNITTVVDGLVSPADICLDIDNGILYAPSLQTGLFYAIQVNVTKPEISTTMADGASKVSIVIQIFIVILISIIM